MIKGIDHIGLAVEDLEATQSVFDQLLQQQSEKAERVESEQVKVSFYHTAKGKIELLQGMSADSNIASYIRKKGEGIHHVALAVDDIESEMARVANQGFELINNQPKEGAGGKLVCFLHPRTTNGVLVELCQNKED
jgi:methylmalonyl-CoA/ethylmalonyl-CoA epimerase